MTRNFYPTSADLLANDNKEKSLDLLGSNAKRQKSQTTEISLHSSNFVNVPSDDERLTASGLTRTCPPHSTVTNNSQVDFSIKFSHLIDEKEIQNEPSTEDVDHDDIDDGIKKVPLEPLTSHRIIKRQKAIDFGKNTLGYDEYLKRIPKSQRKRMDPMTPDIFQQCSRRSWEGQIKKWRRLLHKYDPPTVSSKTGQKFNLKKTTDNEYLYRINDQKQGQMQDKNDMGEDFQRMDDLDNIYTSNSRKQNANALDVQSLEASLMQKVLSASGHSCKSFKNSYNFMDSVHLKTITNDGVGLGLNDKKRGFDNEDVHMSSISVSKLSTLSSKCQEKPKSVRIDDDFLEKFFES